MGKGYSAGAIYLQVVPVFGDVQKAIAGQARDIDRVLGDEMEKSGKKAGERAGKAASDSMNKEMEKGTSRITSEMQRNFESAVGELEKALGKIDTSKMGDRVKREVRAMRAELRDLSGVDVSIEDNFKQVDGRLKDLRAHLKEMERGTKINLEFDSMVGVYREIGKVQAAVDAIDSTINLDVDTTPAVRKMGFFERQIKKTMASVRNAIDNSGSEELQNLADALGSLGDEKVGVTISSTQFKREFDEIMADVAVLSKQHPEIGVRLAAAKAISETIAFNRALDVLDGRNIRVDVDLRTANASDLLARLRGDADDAANSFRSFNIILFAAAGLGPALVPSLGAIAGGLLAIGPAAAVAGASIGGLLVGFSGLGDVLTALDARDKAAATVAQTLGNKEASAAKSAANARKSAARAVESALRQQENAQERYAKSIQDVKDAEEALRQAREAAKGTGADIKQRIGDNKLAQDQGLLDVFNATVTYNSVQADGSATNAEKEQARINLEQARNALRDLRKEAKDLAAEQKKWDEQGVNGTDAVKSAQDNLNSALDAQKDAYQGLRDAAQAVDDARTQGAEQVTQALKAQGAALDTLTSQQNAVNVALAKLGPAGRDFALFLYSLRKPFQDFRNDVQSVLLPSIQEAITGFMGSKNADIGRSAIIGLAAGFGDFAKTLSTSFQGKAWEGFFQMLADLGPSIQAAYGRAFTAMLEGLASVLTILAPYALQFANGFAKIMESFARWAASKEGAEGIQGFMGYVKEVAPDVLRFVGAFSRAMTALLIALAPYGAVVLGLITNFLDFIATLDPEVLTTFATGLLILITASQSAYAVFNLMRAGGALLASTMGPLVLLVVGLGLAFAYAYTHSEAFREFMDGPLGKAVIAITAAIVSATLAYVAYRKILLIVTAVQAGYTLATTGAILATTKLTRAQTLGALAAKVAAVAARAFSISMWLVTAALNGNPLVLVTLLIIALVAAIVIAYKKNEKFREIVQRVWAAIKNAFSAAWEVIKPILIGLGELFVEAFGYIKMAWEQYLWPVLRAIGITIFKLYRAYFKVALVLIMALVKVVFLAIKAYWRFYLKPVLSAWGKVMLWLWNKAIKPVLGWIRTAWGKMVDGIKWAWERTLKPVFDYIADRALPKLKSAFKTAVDAIKSLWGGLKKIVGAPVKFVLDTVINKGLIGGFNKVAKWVGMDGFDEIPIPKSLQSYATGGIMPGYTPGRDPHKFVSPTGGRLELSGGEAIMRPEWTRAVGPDYVNAMNAAARSGGVAGLRKMMRGQAYAKGGIFFPLPGAVMSTYRNHDGVDLNVPGGDKGLPFYSATRGTVAYTGYGRGYGNAVFINSPFGSLVYGHSLENSIRVRAGQRVEPGTPLARVGSTGNSTGPHLHFGHPGGTYAFASGLLRGVDVGVAESMAVDGGRSIPSWLMSIAKNPLKAVKGWITDPIKDASKALTSSPVFDIVAGMPMRAAKGVTDKVWGIMPGWIKSAAGWAGDAADWVAGGVKSAGSLLGSAADGAADLLGFADGGILPYNGTMMYDNGGYLPPGMTTVMNLTGKPEPVFTSNQWEKMDGQGGKGGTGIHYEPHFNESNLTAADVAQDLNFELRRLARGGRYAGVGN